MTVCDKSHTHMITPWGSLWHCPDGRGFMVSELEKQGYRIVVNPKRNYYPERDKTHPSFQNQEIIDPNEDIDLLVEERI